MDNNACDELIALHRQIATELMVEGLDEGKRLRLEQLQTDIAGALELCEDETSPDLAARLKEEIDEFQVSHPQLTLLIGQLMERLSNAGF